MALLSSIGDGAYNVKVKVVDSQDHGVPQSRLRLYIVGILNNMQAHEFEFPEPLPRVSLSTFLDPLQCAPSMGDLPPKKSATARGNVQAVLQDLSAKGAAPLTNTYVYCLIVLGIDPLWGDSPHKSTSPLNGGIDGYR